MARDPRGNNPFNTAMSQAARDRKLARAKHASAVQQARLDYEVATTQAAHQLRDWLAEARRQVEETYQRALRERCPEAAAAHDAALVRADIELARELEAIEAQRVEQRELLEMAARRDSRRAHLLAYIPDPTTDMLMVIDPVLWQEFGHHAKVYWDGRGEPPATQHARAIGPRHVQLASGEVVEAKAFHEALRATKA